MSTAELRRRLRQEGLSEAELNPDPMAQFDQWFQQATAAGVYEPSATCLATATPQGEPSVRMVLLKGIKDRRFLFFSNYESRKARELAENPRAALVVAWVELARQVRISGRVDRIPRGESARYFETRPVGSRLSAWASPQSEVIDNRRVLEDRQEHFRRQFADGDIPLPPFWGGYCLVPTRMEFWQGRPDRLHDRLRYRLDGDRWVVERLAP